MTTREYMLFKQPVLRVNNRQDNIDFYETVLGMKRLREENALTIFTAHDNQHTYFTIEESPAPRTKATTGPHKLYQMVIRLSSEDILGLLARPIEVEAVFKGEHYAFVATSPEGARFLVHAEEDVTKLAPSAYPSLAPLDDFKGVSDFSVESLTLAVRDTARAKAFYSQLFGDEFPLKIDFITAQGEDLEASPDKTWDLEILEFHVSEGYDLAALAKSLKNLQLEVYLDAKARLLVVSDTSNIEVWISK
ncbi:CppA N-terminal domain-containing protein [Streptococcus sp. zg-JUN1979]|uniref:CppA N-terminal domain-containing protein n=1 Tax=Streptococcus sp. zg-JUN1979 TaxID=3391450 RepID=UPI0039A54B46